MKSQIVLTQDDIRAVLESHFRSLGKNVSAVTVVVSPGYEGNQFDHQDPSVHAVVEHVEGNTVAGADRAR